MTMPGQLPPGMSAQDFWLWWSGAPKGGGPSTFGTAPWELPSYQDLGSRTRGISSRVRPDVWNNLSNFDRTRLARIGERLQDFDDILRRRPLRPGEQRAVENLINGGRRIVGDVRDRLIRQGVLRHEIIHGPASGPSNRLIIRNWLRQFVGSTGGLMLLTAVLVAMIFGVGLWLNKQQRDLMDAVRRLADSPDPENVVIGPPVTGDCAREAMLQEGLIWTESGWRAPQADAEPALYTYGYEDGDVRRYKADLVGWVARIRERVTDGLDGVERDCGSDKVGEDRPPELGVFVLTNVSGGSLWTGSTFTLQDRRACDFVGGGLCDGTSPPVEYSMIDGPFRTQEGLVESFCAAVYKPLWYPPLVVSSRIGAYGAEYWVAGVPACPDPGE